MITKLTLVLTNSVLFKQQLIQMDSMNSPEIYKLLLENIFEEPTVTILNGRKCVQIFIKSIDTYSKQFQFKIIHNYLNVNYNLYKWILVETSLCSCCLTEVETLSHLFCSCSVVKTLYL